MTHSSSSELANAALEFHDSEVSGVHFMSGCVHVTFSAAYVHRSNEVPGVDVGSGYMQSVQLLLREAVLSGPLNDCVGKLSDGNLRVNGRSVNLVPLPFEAAGQIALILQFSNGASFSAAGSSVQLHQTSAPRFVEHFGC
jgi:hypothetical protein